MKQQLLLLIRAVKKRCRLPPLKETTMKALSLAVTNTTCVIMTIRTNSIIEANQQMYAAAIVVTQDLEIKLRKYAKAKQNKQPARKKR